eukprot:2250904-Alexandrium_andersonii.AAC.1
MASWLTRGSPRAEGFARSASAMGLLEALPCPRPAFSPLHRPPPGRGAAGQKPQNEIVERVAWLGLAI